MKTRFISLFLLFFILTNHLFADYKWKKFGDLIEPRDYFCAVSISPTKILIIGGQNSQSGALRTCEIIDINDSTITRTADMLDARTQFVSLLTSDFNVIVLSGLSTPRSTQNCELYDRLTNTWKIIGNLNFSRFQHAAEFINNDEILIIGGRHDDLSCMKNSEIYNIKTNLSRNIADYPWPFNYGYVIKSIYHKNLVFAGRFGGVNSGRDKHVYYYDNNLDSWVTIDSLLAGNVKPAVLRLFNNNYLVTGGSYYEDPFNFAKEIYTVNNDVFHYTCNMLTERVWHELAQWNNDSVINVGGYDNSGADIKFTEWYNVTTNSVSQGPDLITPRSFFQLVSMPARPGHNGRAILAIGGSHNGTVLNSIEILEDDSPMIDPPPQVLTTSSDCENYYFAVFDKKNIDFIETNDNFNKNVKITYQPQYLPIDYVTVTVSLIDKTQNGYFKITCIDLTTKKNVTVTDSITNHPGLLKITSTMTNGYFWFDSVSLTIQYCKKITISNSGNKDIFINNGYFNLNTDFSILPNEIPCIIPANGNKDITICFTPSKEGELKDTLNIEVDCDLLELPVKGYGLPIAPPHILSQSVDCANYYFTVFDAKNIDSIETNNSYNKNVIISYQPQPLPQDSVVIIVTLIDKTQDGYFNITCKNNTTNKNLTVIDSITNHSGFLKVSSTLTNGYFWFDSVLVSNVLCKTFTISNSFDKALQVNNIYFNQNIQFTLPPNQIPCTIPANGTKDITICFSPTFEGELNDTLNIDENCDSLKLPVKGYGVPQSAPPQILTQSLDCENYYFTVFDAKNIDSIEINNGFNKNVNITYQPQPLPQDSMLIKVSLIDITQNGYFSVTCKNNTTNKSITIVDSITNHPGLLKITSTLTNGYFWFDSILVSNLLCKTFTISNSYDKDIQVNKIYFNQNIQFSVPPNQIPCTIPANGSKDITICFTPTLEGELNDTLNIEEDCDSLKLPVQGYGLPNAPPQILTQSINCENYYFTVFDSKNIGSIETNNSFNKNVNITYQPQPLPHDTVLITVSLIDKTQNGYFSITCHSIKTNKSITIIDSITRHSGSLRVCSTLSNGYFWYDSVYLSNVFCKNITLENTSNEDIIVDNAYFSENTEFSIPQSQIPFTIPALGKKDVKICFYTVNMGEQEDILNIEEKCNTLKIPVKAFGLANDYLAVGKCGINLKLKTNKVIHQLYAVAPYPNPATDAINIELYSNDEQLDITAVKCNIKDVLGNIIYSYYARNFNKVENQDDGLTKYTGIIKLESIHNGCYYLEIQSESVIQTFPIIVYH